jgi:ATP-binding protein involved in chromosome partitioning
MSVSTDFGRYPQVRRHLPQNGVKSLPEIKNIIAVASGKGGVGKSTVALNLALGLTKLGARVGLLDADIYGPSQPHMLGVTQKPEINSDKTMQPIMAHGLQTMSIGYLINADTPAVWRGPMVSGALQQMLSSSSWYALDFLIVDLPPGTGDVQLTMAQKIPVCGAVIVSTPQDVALLDVKKAIAMFTRVKVPILGIVENMGMHVCSNCAHTEHIFGIAGGARLAEEFKVPLLGSLPLDRTICELGDSGTPLLIAQPEAMASKIYSDIARNVMQELAKTPRDLSVPNKIVLEEVGC